MDRMLSFIIAKASLALLLAVAPAYAQPTLEDLGQPMDSEGTDIDLVTEAPDGGKIAWAALTGGPHARRVVGVHVPSGELTEIDLIEFGNARTEIFSPADDHLIIFGGRPGRFMRYDIATGELTELGIPNDESIYWMGSVVDQQGRFYIGAYPGANPMRYDPTTETFEDLGRLPDDDRQMYITVPAISDDNIIYFPVGLNHPQLFSFDPETDRFRSILPDDLAPDHQGAPRVWRAEDGHVYGRIGREAYFRCEPEGVVVMDDVPESADERPVVDGVRYSRLTADGELVMHDLESDQRRTVRSDWEGVGIRIYSVAEQYDGRIWGGGFSPAHLYSFDPETGRMQDHGRRTSGRIQIYDILRHDRGLFLSSYMGAFIDLYNPHSNDHTRVARLQDQGQERPYRLIEGPDGMIYTCTTPVKGHLDGALARIDPDTLEVTVWRNIIEDQSVRSIAPVPETGEIFAVTNVHGGGQVSPTQDEALVFLFDTESEQVVERIRLFPDRSGYGAVARAETGVIYGRAGDEYYAFDPVSRQLLHTGELPEGTRVRPDLHPKAVGPEGYIYGIKGEAVYRIDPRDHSLEIVLRDERLNHGHGFYVTDDGRELYVGIHDRLFRARLR